MSTFHPLRVFVSSLVAAMLAVGTGCSAVSVSHQAAPERIPGHVAAEPSRDGAAVDLDSGADATPSDNGDPTDGGDASSTHVKGFPAGTVVWPENGHGYLLVTQTTPLTWDVARADAESRGGHLVTLTSQAENDFVYSLVGTVDAAYSNNGAGDNGPWLGAYQPVRSGVPPAPGTNRGPFFDDEYPGNPNVAYIVEFE